MNTRAQEQKPEEKRMFDVVNILGENVLTIESVVVGKQRKSYLGEHGRRIVHRIIEKYMYMLLLLLLKHYLN